jgi:hypothetical protein
MRGAKVNIKLLFMTRQRYIHPGERLGFSVRLTRRLPLKIASDRRSLLFRGNHQSLRKTLSFKLTSSSLKLGSCEAARHSTQEAGLRGKHCVVWLPAKLDSLAAGPSSTIQNSSAENSSAHRFSSYLESQKTSTMLACGVKLVLPIPSWPPVLPYPLSRYVQSDGKQRGNCYLLLGRSSVLMAF